MPTLRLFFILTLLFFIAPPAFAQSVGGASEFNPQYILSDEEFTETASLSESAIQAFLETHSSPLAEKQLPDKDGNFRKPAAIISQAAKQAQISPKALLVILQKEQSLITDPNPSERQLDFAMGYGCRDGEACVEGYKGFGKQIAFGAMGLRQYLNDIKTNGETISGWGVGTTRITGDGFLISPASAATAALYTYTPWRGDIQVAGHRIGGNFSFWNLWQQWFSKIYPDGSLLQEEGSPLVWLIQGGRRRPFLSKGAFLSRFSPSEIITVPQGELVRFEIGSPIKFPQYALLKDPSGKIYLLVDDERRWISSWEVFRNIGFNPEEVISADTKDIALYSEGKPITLSDSYPMGALLQDKKSGGVYFVKNGIKHPILSRLIMKLDYPNLRPIKQASKTLETYAAGDPVRLKDGMLVKATSPLVYIISNGMRRAIVNEDVFTRLGYRWNDIKTIDERTLELHPEGEPLALPKKQEIPVTVLRNATAQ